MDFNFKFPFLFFFIFLVFTLSFLSNVSALFGYNNPKLPRIEPVETTTVVQSINNNTVNVNNTQCWQNYCTPQDFNQTLTITEMNSSWLSTYNATYHLWAYNQTTATFDLYNTMWNSTFNITYQGLIQNSSYLSTYNVTYALWSYNQSNIFTLNDCGTGNYGFGFYSNGTIKCRADQQGAGGSAPFQATATTIYNNTANIFMGLGTSIPRAKLWVEGANITTYWDQQSDANTITGIYSRTNQLDNEGIIYGIKSESSCEFQALSATCTNYGIYSNASVTTVDTPIGTMYGVYSEVAHGNNQYVYYGKATNSYGGANSYGIYLTGEDKNYFSGSVGIGTIAPKKKFDVVGSGVVEAIINASAGNPSAANLYLSRFDMPNGYAGLVYSTSGSDDWTINVPAGTDDLRWYDHSGTAGERMRLQNKTGNLGLGTASPQRKLDINGTARIGNDTSTFDILTGGFFTYTSGRGGYLVPTGGNYAFRYAGVNATGVFFNDTSPGGSQVDFRNISGVSEFYVEVSTTGTIPQVVIPDGGLSIRDGFTTGESIFGDGDLYVEDDVEIDGVATVTTGTVLCLENNIITLDGGSGTCSGGASPFYYDKLPSGKEFLGAEFLAELNSPDKESIQTFPLPYYGRYGAVYEKKEETAHIDVLTREVLYRDKWLFGIAGSEVIRTLKQSTGISELDSNDGIYYVMTKDQFLNIDWGELPIDESQVIGVYLQTEGYYITDEDYYTSQYLITNKEIQKRENDEGEIFYYITFNYELKSDSSVSGAEDVTFNTAECINKDLSATQCKDYLDTEVLPKQIESKLQVVSRQTSESSKKLDLGDVSSIATVKESQIEVALE